ncbi:hypothetical protein SKAU_G00316560 [Synaphobranchus kaupii]|uniref:Uncharacterized protein n=1 Tax=Synaphobranchus kaupii TaxID=118154 RepID=A0A9Q1EST9_SYNKA|nr:hypothetical protein SKAU_G00316560 [Synaphobranchus kaupii]
MESGGTFWRSSPFSPSQAQCSAIRRIPPLICDSRPADLRILEHRPRSRVVGEEPAHIKGRKGCAEKDAARSSPDYLDTNIFAVYVHTKRKKLIKPSEVLLILAQQLDWHRPKFYASKSREMVPDDSHSQPTGLAAELADFPSRPSVCLQSAQSGLDFR